jgi:Zn-dependent protease with chaperone function
MALISFEAKYYDGEKAAPYQVLVEIYRTNLHIKTPDNSLEKNWPYKEINILDQPVPPQPARLTTRKTPNARLYIEPENWSHLKAKLPKSAFPSITLSTSWNYLIGYAGLSVIFILGTVLFGPKLFEYAGQMIPQNTEEKIGQLAIESSINNPVCVAAKGQVSLEKIVHKLQQGMKRDIVFNVRVVSDDETLNAFAAPGGHLVIFSGILKKADSVDEVAGVLAHEMAHIEMNHPMKSLTRNLGISLTLQMMFGNTGTVSNTAKLAGIFNQLHYSRQDELEADLVGQNLLRKANIDPSGLELFFKRLKKEETARNSGDESDFPEFLAYFSTHPHTQTRINKLKTNEISATNYKKALNKKEWQALKDICAEKMDIN